MIGQLTFELCWERPYTSKCQVCDLGPYEEGWQEDKMMVVKVTGPIGEGLLCDKCARSLAPEYAATAHLVNRIVDAIHRCGQFEVQLAVEKALRP